MQKKRCVVMLGPCQKLSLGYCPFADECEFRKHIEKQAALRGSFKTVAVNVQESVNLASMFSNTGKSFLNMR